MPAASSVVVVELAVNVVEVVEVVVEVTVAVVGLGAWNRFQVVALCLLFVWQC